MTTIRRRIALTAFAAAGLIACAANTKYTGVAVETLNDEQIAEELTSAVKGLGMAADRTTYLMAMRPEPAYVMTSSSSTFSGTMNASYNSYSMPRGYGVATIGTVQGAVRGATTTQYQYTDVNAGARLGNAIATAISRSQQGKYQHRADEVWKEYQLRSERRRRSTEMDIASFFNAHPDLESRRMLVAAVAPWVAAQAVGYGQGTLERAAVVIAGMIRGQGVSGPWYGMFSQTSILASGETVAFSQFVKLDLSQVGSKVTGKGTLGSGEVIELEGQMDGPRMSAAVANTSSAINVALSGIAATSQITGEFSGSGAGQRLTGTVVLLR